MEETNINAIYPLEGARGTQRCNLIMKVNVGLRRGKDHEAQNADLEKQGIRRYPCEPLKST